MGSGKFFVIVVLFLVKRYIEAYLYFDGNDLSRT